MSKVLGAALSGVDGVAVEVEVGIRPAVPRIDIVGLPEAAVRESAARVRAAISAIGQKFPDAGITVNLAPAGLRKSGAGLDLAIAVAILSAAGVVPPDSLARVGLVGELALDARLRPVRGALALALALRDAGCRAVVVPMRSGPESALAPGLAVLAAHDLAAVVAHLLRRDRLPRAVPAEPAATREALCVSEVRGQERAKRALEVTAAGGHGLLLLGPPGAGKTMLASRVPGLLPPLSFEEALETTRIHGAAGRLADEPVVSMRPFRAPHHSASPAGLLGGGNPPRPGEVSLAHRGVLFLDELPEFDRRALEAMRQVLEEQSVSLARAGISCVFPAHFLLVAAANPCPCGWYKSGQRDCRCDDGVRSRYRRRLSGPLLDRIDLHVTLSGVAWRELELPASGPTSREIRERVERARRIQHDRGFAANAEIPDRLLDDLVEATPDARQLLGRAVDRLQLSARGARRVLRIARTIADLSEDSRVSPAAMAEAVGYRSE